MGFFFIVATIFLLFHIAEWRNRHKILAVLNQKTPIGQVETWLNVLKNRYRHDVFAIRRDFYGELIFTEKAIIIFRMMKLGPIKLRSDTLILAKNFDDKPQVDSFWYQFQTGMLYRLDNIEIDGRRVLLECTYTMPPGMLCNRTILYKFLIPDLRDNDAYKNMLLLHRHLREHKIF